MAPLYVYGFAPRMTQEDFQNQFFEPFSEDYCDKVDFKGDKIYAFVHTHTLEQANEIINYWNGKKMGDGLHPLQVRHKGQNNHNSGNNAQFGNQQKQQDPVLYVYGFPKGMTEEIFASEFFGENMDACKKIDFFGEKLYAFVHCHNSSQCDGLIGGWDQKMMNGSKRPLQVRYKGDSGQQNQQWLNMPPVIWVYGFPPKTTQDNFVNEFFLKFPNSLKKVDFYEKKLYAFVHCHNSRQCQDLISHWDGKMMQNSTQPLQVRFKGMNTKNQNNMNGNGMNFGQNQFYQPNGQFFNNGMMMKQNPHQQNQMMQQNSQFGMQFGMPMQGQQQPFQPQQMQHQQQGNNMGNFNPGMQSGGWGGMMMPQQQFNPNQYGMNKRPGNGNNQQQQNSYNPNQNQQFMQQNQNRFNHPNQQGGPTGMVGGPQHKKGRFN